MYDVMQSDDVGVLQLAEQRDLPNRCARRTLLVLQPDLLQRHQRARQQRLPLHTQQTHSSASHENARSFDTHPSTLAYCLPKLFLWTFIIEKMSAFDYSYFRDFVPRVDLFMRVKSRACGRNRGRLQLQYVYIQWTLQISTILYKYTLRISAFLKSPGRNLIEKYRTRPF